MLKNFKNILSQDIITLSDMTLVNFDFVKLINNSEIRKLIFKNCKFVGDVNLTGIIFKEIFFINCSVDISLFLNKIYKVDKLYFEKSIISYHNMIDYCNRQNNHQLIFNDCLLEKYNFSQKFIINSNFVSNVEDFLNLT